MDPRNGCRLVALLTCFLAITGFTAAPADESDTSAPPAAVAGTIDLSGWDFGRDGLVPLAGEWQFSWKRLQEPSAPDSTLNDRFLTVPNAWNGTRVRDTTIESFGYATYRLTVRNANSTDDLALWIRHLSVAYRCYVNGRLVAANGAVGRTRNEETPEMRAIVSEPFPQADSYDIVIHVSNFHHGSGGFRTTVLLGREDNLLRRRERTIALYMLTFGGAFFFGLYNLISFIWRRSDRALFYFGLIAINIGLDSLTTGEGLLTLLFPLLPWRWYLAIDWLTYVAAPVGALFMIELFRPAEKTWIRRSFIFVAVFELLFLVIPPARVYTGVSWVFASITAVSLSYVLFTLGWALVKRVEGTAFFLIGALVIVPAAVWDTLYSMDLIATDFQLLPLGMLFFVVSESFYLSARSAKAFSNIERLTEDLRYTNRSIIRFVPTEFIETLGKDSITEIQIGDQVSRTMAVLFADIRNFTGRAETMTPEESFSFLNRYLRRMGPAVRNNGGFVDKYIGDGLMALFDQPDDAFVAAICMLDEVDTLNSENPGSSNEPLRIGIGIHYGDLMLGAIGEGERIQTTVISDAVNTANRIEQLTREYATQLLVSDEVYTRLSGTNRTKCSPVATASVKGRQNAVALYRYNETHR